MMARFLSLLLVLAAGIAAVRGDSDLDSLAGTGQHQPGTSPSQAQGQAPDDGEPPDKPTDALISVPPTNLNPILGSLLLPQWLDDRNPDLWVGQGQLFLKNKDPARALCNATYTVRIDFAKDQVAVGMRNLTLLGTYGTNMKHDVFWLRGKLPRWMPRCDSRLLLRLVVSMFV